MANQNSGVPATGAQSSRHVGRVEGNTYIKVEKKEDGERRKEEERGERERGEDRRQLCVKQRSAQEMKENRKRKRGGRHMTRTYGRSLHFCPLLDLLVAFAIGWLSLATREADTSAGGGG